jgi:hypothetical protein
MQTELTTTPHPHDPHAEDLTWSQAEDVLRYFTPPGHRLHWHVSSTTWVTLFRDGEVWQHGSTFEECLRYRELWPDPSMCPPPPRFTAIGPAVMLAGEQIATTRGNTMAKRIAHALNWYKPGRRGT